MKNTTLLFIVLLTSFLLWHFGDQARAWVRGYQPFPGGEATVVLHRFCRGQDCALSDTQWRGFIREAVNTWNGAGAKFTFSTRPHRSSDDPCNLPGEVAIIQTDPDTLCPGDGPLLDRSYTVGRIEYRLGGVRIYIKDRPVPGAGTRSDAIRQVLLHELGHAVGLDHPDEQGQTVQAVMNTSNYYTTLQPDDIAGIRALYGTRETTGGSGGRRGALEVPAANASLSGSGVISGWVCDADRLRIDIRDAGGSQIALSPLSPVYRIERPDTLTDCGDTNNGFRVPFDWGRVSAGTYTIYVEVDGHRLDRQGTTVRVVADTRVTCWDGSTAPTQRECPRDTRVTCWDGSKAPTQRECPRDTRVTCWDGSKAPTQRECPRDTRVTCWDGSRAATQRECPADTRSNAQPRSSLENPAPNSFHSGIGLISGWVCEAEEVAIDIRDSEEHRTLLYPPYGMERGDTEDTCEDTDNGFGVLFNWNLLGDGTYTVYLEVDGDRLNDQGAIVTVMTLGQEFLQGAEGEYELDNFPEPGQSVVVEWSEPLQNFVIVERR